MHVATAAETLGTVWVGKAHVFCRGKRVSGDLRAFKICSACVCVWGRAHQDKEYLTNRNYICKCAPCVSLREHARGKASADVRGGGDVLRGRPTRVRCMAVCELELLYKRTLAENTGGHRVRVFMVRQSVCTYVISINIYSAVFFGRLELRFSVLSASCVHSLTCSAPWQPEHGKRPRMPSGCGCVFINSTIWHSTSISAFWILSELQNASSAQRYWRLMFICRRAGELRISFRIR